MNLFVPWLCLHVQLDIYLRFPLLHAWEPLIVFCSYILIRPRTCTSWRGLRFDLAHGDPRAADHVRLLVHAARGVARHGRVT